MKLRATFSRMLHVCEFAGTVSVQVGVHDCVAVIAEPTGGESTVGTIPSRLLQNTSTVRQTKSFQLVKIGPLRKPQ
jgi:hypothetical protein